MACKIGLVDLPGGRKQHGGTVPLIGGVAIYLVLLCSDLLFRELNVAVVCYLLAAGLLVITGLFDDYFDLPVRIRVCGQLLVALIMIMGAGNQINSVGNILAFGELLLGWLAVPFTLIAVFGLVNAYNMMDGIDGLAGGLAILSFSSIAVLSHGSLMFSPVPVQAFVIALCTFLLFNLQIKPITKSKVFLGDAGSTLIGFSVAWALIEFTQGTGNHKFDPVVALWIAGLPLLDMVRVAVNRLRVGGSPFKPDRGHVHHMFLRIGYTARETLAIILLLALSVNLLGVSLYFFGASESVSLMAFFAVYAVYGYAINRTDRLEQWRRGDGLAKTER